MQKIKRQLSAILVFLLVFSMSPGLPPTALAEEDEREDGYIPVSTREALAGMADDLGGKYRLTADIDLEGEPWTPVGDGDNPFTGVLDGDGYAISNMTIEAEDAAYQGLFGALRGEAGEAAVVSGLTLSGSMTITGDESDYTGGLAGYAENSEITGCIVEVDIVKFNMGSYTGGIVGMLAGENTISYSANKGSISLNREQGTSTNAVRTSIGGIAGYTDSGDDVIVISHCYNTGDLYNLRSGAAGIVGCVAGDGDQISNCYNIGDITVSSSVLNSSGHGNIAGHLTGKPAALENCYGAGRIDANRAYGGIVGFSGIAGEIGNAENLANNYYVVYTDDEGDPIYAGIGIGALNSMDVYEKTMPITDGNLDVLHVLLGEAYVADTEEINGGYPLLAWQTTGDGGGGDELDCTITVDLSHGEAFWIVDAPQSARLGESVTVTVSREDQARTQGLLGITVNGVSISTSAADRVETDAGNIHQAEFTVTVLSRDVIIGLEIEHSGLHISYDRDYTGADLTWADMGALTGANGEALSYSVYDGEERITGVSDSYVTVEQLLAEGEITYWKSITFIGVDGEEVTLDRGELEENTYALAVSSLEDGGGADSRYAYHLVAEAGDGDAPRGLKWVTGLEVTPANEIDGEGYRLIADQTDLENVQVGRPEVKYRLTGDIFLEGQWLAIGRNSGLDADAAKEVAFQGEFDGGGYTIWGLNSDLGLFSHTYGAVVKNLTVQGVVDGSASYAGGIIATAYETLVYNCVSDVEVSGGGSFIAGVVGRAAEATVVSHCVNLGTVTNTREFASNSYGYAGGIVGSLSGNSTVQHCYNTGEISAVCYAGGIAGSTWSGTAVVSDSYNLGRVSVRNEADYAAGGILGYMWTYTATIVNTYSISAPEEDADGEEPLRYSGILGNVASAYYGRDVSNSHYLDTAAWGVGFYEDGAWSGMDFLEWGGEEDELTAPFSADDRHTLADKLGEAFLNDDSLNDDEGWWTANGLAEYAGYPTLRWQQLGLDDVRVVRALTDPDGVWTISVSDPLPSAGDEVTVTVSRAADALTTTLEALTVNGEAYPISDNALELTLTVEEDITLGVTARYSDLALTVEDGESLTLSRTDMEGLAAVNSEPREYAAQDENGQTVGAADSYVTLDQLLARAGVNDWESITFISIDGETVTLEPDGLGSTEPILTIRDAQITGGSQSDLEGVSRDAVYAYRLVAGGDTLSWVTAVDILPAEDGNTGLDGAGDVPADTEIEGGTATVTVDDEALSRAAEEADGNTEIVLSGDYGDGDLDRVIVSVGGDALGDVADAGASVRVETPLADVGLSNEALRDIAGRAGGTVTVTVTRSSDGGVTVDIAVDGESIPEVAGGIRLSIPLLTLQSVDSGGLVAVRTDNGADEVIRKSIVINERMLAPLAGGGTVELRENAKTFGDVAGTDWHYPYVNFASARELVEGVSATSFAPDATLTRGMLATLLYRLEDEPAGGGSNPFDDVPDGEWYTAAVAWAADLDLIQGTGSGNFEPDRNITREEMVTLLYRYAGWLDIADGTRGSLSGFPDGGETADWALEAMQWAVGVKLVGGMADGTLAPGNTATRAEAAAILQRVVALMYGEL